MKKKLLIVTPNKSFGDLLKSDLEMNKFRAKLVNSSDAALTAKDINLAILDADINDPSMESLCSMLLEKNPGMVFIIIHSLDQSIELSGVPETSIKAISRPFDFPTLLLAIQEIFNPEPNPGIGSESAIEDNQGILSTDEMTPSAAFWFDDAAIIRERLKTSIFTPLIREAVLISTDRILGLTWDAAEQTIFALRETITNHRIWISKNPLIKNFRIGEVEHILYTIPLSAGQGIIGIFFDPAIKFSQASAMAKKYAAQVLLEQSYPNIAGDSIDEHKKQTGITTSTQQILLSRMMGPALDYHQNPEVLPGVMLNQAEQSTLYDSPVPGLGTLGGESQSQSKASALPDIQSVEAIPQRWIPEVDPISAASKDAHEPVIVYPWEVDQKALKTSEFDTRVETETGVEDAARTDIFPGINTAEDNQSIDTNPPSSEDTQPVDLKYQSESDIPPVSLSAVRLSPEKMVEYSFLMISNNPEFRMVGEVEEIIGEEILDICQELGWNLLVLLVRSDYLQITVGVPSTMPPGIIIRILREKTTKRIIESFEEIGPNIDSGDFWVKGYLVTNGTETEI